MGHGEARGKEAEEERQRPQSVVVCGVCAGSLCRRAHRRERWDLKGWEQAQQAQMESKAPHTYLRLENKKERQRGREGGRRGRRKGDREIERE